MFITQLIRFWFSSKETRNNLKNGLERFVWICNFVGFDAGNLLLALEEIKAAKIAGNETVLKAKSVAEKQGEEALAKAKNQIENEKIKAKEDIQQERDAAIADLKNHFSDLVLNATENLMRQNIDSEKDKKVIDRIASIYEKGSWRSKDKKLAFA